MLALGFVVRLFYPRPGAINSTFESYLRPKRLKMTISLWMVGIAVVFLTIQWLRIPYYLEFVSRLQNLPRLAREDSAAVWIAAGLLVMLICELIVVVHWLAYLVYCWIGSALYRMPSAKPASDKHPAVLVLIACCDEKPEVLRRSLESVPCMDYAPMRVVLVENSRDLKRKAQAAQLAARFGVEVLHVRNRGHKAGALNDALELLHPAEPYLAVFDTDQKVQPEFLRDLVPVLEQDPRQAFVQTPQGYDNAEATWVCRAAAQQETLLYDTVMEAKGALGRALCCGTNFVMRRQALESVGGWNEASVSEDLATSFQFHRRGWRSLYVRRAYAWGLGPETLAGYWKQQTRWATGNTTVAMQVVRTLLGRKTGPAPWYITVGYLWSSGYYITTLALAGLATLPMLLLLASYVHAPHSLQSVPAARPQEWLFLSVYPFYAVVMLFPYVNMRMRGYFVRNLLMLQGLLAITAPVYIASVFKGVFRRIRRFDIAPKGQSASRRKRLGPQVFVLAALVVCGGLLALRVKAVPGSSVAWIALFWTFFYAFSFSHYFIFSWQERTAAPDEPISAVEPESHIEPVEQHVEAPQN